MASPTDESGITIVEIVLSIVLLGIVLSAFLSVMVGGLQSLTNSGQRQDASQLSTEVIETLRSLTPDEVALYVDPLVTDDDEVDTTALSDCTAQIDDDGDGTIDRTEDGYDPDGTDGPLGCEEFVTASLGAITTAAADPYFDTVGGITVTTVATAAASADVPDGVTRVTVVMEYTLPDGPEVIRRQSLFSEVSRG